MWPLRIICLLLPIAGFIIAIAFWLGKKEEKADEILLFSLIGVLINIILFPILMIAGMIAI